MFATKLGKLLHATRVLSVTRWEGVEVWRVSRVVSLFPSGAMAVGEVIFHSTIMPFDEGIFAHELAHVNQWRKYGSAGFVARYFSQFVWEFMKLALRGKFRNIMQNAYLNIPLEVEARDASAQ